MEAMGVEMKFGNNAERAVELLIERGLISDSNH